MEIIRSRDKYFDDLANYLITLVSLTLTAELYASGKAGRYGSNHYVQLDAKQLGKRLLFYPHYFAGGHVCRQMARQTDLS